MMVYHDPVSPKSLLAISALFTVIAGQVYPRQTQFTNGTQTSSSSPVAIGTGTGTTSVVTPPPCCWIWAGIQGVKINTWYSTTAEQVTATVITTFLQYNNTVVAANSSTKYIPTDEIFTSFGYWGQPEPGYGITNVPGVATTLIEDAGLVNDDGNYAGTTIVPAANGTVATFDFTDLVISSPTPYAEWPVAQIYYSYPDLTVDPGPISTYDASMCGTTDAIPYLVLSSGSWVVSTQTAAIVPSVGFEGLLGGQVEGEGDFPYVTPLSVPMPNSDVFVALPTGLKESMVANKTILSMYPWITNCWELGGEGQPTVHVPVNQITTDSSNTLTIGGILSTTTISQQNTPSAQTPATKVTQTDSEGGASSAVTKPVGGTDLDTVTGTSSTLTLAAPPVTKSTATSVGTPTDGTSVPALPAQDTTITSTQTSPIQVSGGDGSSPSSTAGKGGSGVTDSASASAPAPVATLPAGSQTTISGTTFSALPSGSSVQVVANGLTTTIAQAGGSSSSATGFVIGSQTITAGGSVATSQGSTFSALPSGSGVEVVANGQTSTIAADGNSAVTPVAVPASPTPSSVSGFAVGSQTITAGGSAITSGGTTFSALPSGSGVEVAANGLTSTIVAGDNSVVTPVAVPASPTSSGTGFAIGSTTLTPGGAALTSQGTTFSALLSGSGVQVVSNGQTSIVAEGSSGPITLPGGVRATPVPLSAPTSEVVTIGGSDVSYTPLGTAAAVIGGATLSVGGPAVTEAGETLSLIRQSGGVAVVVDGTTTAPLPAIITGPAQQIVTLGGNVFTAYAAGTSVVVIDGITVRPGTVTVIDGETVSISGSDLVVMSGTITSTEGLGGAILSGLGPSATTTRGSAGAGSTSTSAGAGPTFSLHWLYWGATSLAIGFALYC